jgi:hypothetical protein
MTFKLIACDGGGIRGYISSTLIRDLNTETGGKLLGQADGFAGTSTGGLISIGLGAGVDIATIQNIYATKAKEIFVKAPWFAAASASAAEVMSPGIFGCQYLAKGLKAVMGPLVGTRTFGDLAAGKLTAVVSARLDANAKPPANWQPATLNNIDGAWATVPLIDGCLATSAAPAYFPPHQVPGIGWFADGGTFANNPVMNGIELARNARLLRGYDDVQVISFGTGHSAMGIPASAIGDPLDWGVTKWLRPWASGGVPATALLNLALDLSAANITAVAKGILKDALVRINPALKTAIPLDGYSKADYAAMDVAIAAAKASPDWKEAKAMVANW